MVVLVLVWRLEARHITAIIPRSPHHLARLPAIMNAAASRQPRRGSFWSERRPSDPPRPSSPPVFELRIVHSKSQIGCENGTLLTTASGLRGWLILS
eukprot:scaffold519_cov102-Isochrysis_galbana.AAC.10